MVIILIISLSGCRKERITGNDFYGGITVAFDVASECFVTIEIYDIKSQKIKTLANRVFIVGSHLVVWNGDDDNGNQVGCGMYNCRLLAGTYEKWTKIPLINEY